MNPVSGASWRSNSTASSQVRIRTPGRRSCAVGCSAREPGPLTREGCRFCGRIPYLRQFNNLLLKSRRHRNSTQLARKTKRVAPDETSSPGASVAVNRLRDRQDDAITEADVDAEVERILDGEASLDAFRVIG